MTAMKDGLTLQRKIVWLYKERWSNFTKKDGLTTEKDDLTLQRRMVSLYKEIWSDHDCKERWSDFTKKDGLTLQRKMVSLYIALTNNYKNNRHMLSMYIFSLYHATYYI